MFTWLRKVHIYIYIYNIKKLISLCDIGYHILIDCKVAKFECQALWDSLYNQLSSVFNIN